MNMTAPRKNKGVAGVATKTPKVDVDGVLRQRRVEFGWAVGWCLEVRITAWASGGAADIAPAKNRMN